MKRNKPIFKQRKPGTHWRNRYKSRNYYGDYTRRAEDWRLFVPQSVVGTEPDTFDMTGAVPYGTEGDPDNPSIGDGTYRWRLERDGKTILVYTAWWVMSPRLPDSGDVWYVFKAKGKCQRPRCPMTRYTYADNGTEVPKHRAGTCPLGIPLDAGWKYKSRMEA